MPKTGSVKAKEFIEEPLVKKGEATLKLDEHFPKSFATSNFRHVFQTTDEMKKEFAKFLNTIFYQLDEKRVFSLMEELLSKPEKTDDEIYQELLLKIQTTKKKFPILSKLWSLFVLKKGLGKQISQLMKGFRQDKFHDYMEIYDRRYFETIRKTVGLKLDGKVIAVCDNSSVTFADKIQAGTLFSYPYRQHVNLNDEDCSDPLLQTEKTYKAIPDEEVDNNSLDLIACLGGLHHIPEDKADDFVKSLHKKLRPGAVILLRDHNLKAAGGNKDDLRAMAAVVHSFVNATDGVSLEVENNEIRAFKSEKKWTQLMEKHGFKRISNESLILNQDPTKNAMFAFVKNPTTLEELKGAIKYRNDCTRPKEGTRATWIEWGNVRFSEQYAEYIQKHHYYAFDFIGHMRQNWTHFFHFLKECIQNKDIRLMDALFSDNMVMNLFIVTAVTMQCSISFIGCMPSAMYARWKHGKNWRNVCNLTELEKFEARNAKEYAEFLVHTPFYSYPYISKMQEMWKVIWNSKESYATKFFSSLSAATNSISFIARAIIFAPIRAFYTSDAYQEPDTIRVLIRDFFDELDEVTKRWEKEKDPTHEKKCKIEVLLETPDGYKLVYA